MMLLVDQRLRYALCIAAGFVSGAALAFGYVKMKKDENREMLAQQEIAEVLIVNELSRKCAEKHNISGRQSNESFEMDRSLNGPKCENWMSRSKFICDNPYCAINNSDRLVHYFNMAKYSIDIAMYTFTVRKLANAIVSAHKRGVFIRLIYDREMMSGSQVDFLMKNGVVRRSPPSQISVLMHHKFCIIDGQKRARNITQYTKRNYDTNAPGILITGSLNWTNQGLNSNFENMAITSNKKLVQGFEKEFERIWLQIGQ